MNEKIDTLKKWIDESKNIVFLEAQEYQLKVEFLILEAKMVYIIKNINIRQKKY